MKTLWKSSSAIIQMGDITVFHFCFFTELELSYFLASILSIASRISGFYYFVLDSRNNKTTWNIVKIKMR